MLPAELPDLASLLIRLHPPVVASGRQAHAAFLKLIQEGAPDLAAELHERDRLRPFTVALLPAEKALRCTLLEGRVLAALKQRLLANDCAARLRLGPTTYDIAAVEDQSGTWTGRTTWSALLAGASTSRDIALEFATPTCFSRDGDGTRKRVDLFPQPERVWESWARKWAAFAPDPLDSADVAAAAARWVLVSDYTLRTHTLDYSRFTQKGFTGCVRYELLVDTPDAIARQLNLLADFAFYAGTGYKTAQGLGQTRRR